MIKWESREKKEDLISQGDKHDLTLRSSQEDLETIQKLQNSQTKKVKHSTTYLCFGEFKSSVGFFLKHVLSLQYLITTERKFPPFLRALNCND